MQDLAIRHGQIGERLRIFLASQEGEAPNSVLPWETLGSSVAIILVGTHPYDNQPILTLLSRVLCFATADILEVVEILGTRL